nr:MAG TPA: repressor domain protein [Bacteriophage sp.]
MEELQIFNSDEFGTIRIKTIDGEPWFVAKDVADKLGYAQTSNMMKRIDEEDSKSSILDGMNMKSSLINESGLYSAIIGSKLDSAKRFKRWVTSDVLPSIRKNGGYIANQENMTPEQIVANALIVAQNIISQKDKQIEEMRPKADFFDAVADSKTAISMNEVSKVLGIKGLGRNNLFEFLRDNAILDRWNVPYQKYIDCGWFRVIEQKYTKNGEEHISIKTLVYQKGVDAIRRKIEAQRSA